MRNEGVEHREEILMKNKARLAVALCLLGAVVASAQTKGSASSSLRKRMLSGEKLNYVVGPRRPGDVEQIYSGVAKSERVLGWKTELNIEDAMRDAWNWELALAERAKRTP